MMILGIESATAQVGVALGGEAGVLASVHSSVDRRHAESLTPQMKFVCEQAQVELSDVDAVAVDIGPGLFTGLRVGIASAMAVAHGLGVPMVGVSSLDLGAHAASHTSRLIVPCYDARRGEVFSAQYRSGSDAEDGLERTSDAVATTPEQLAVELTELADEVLIFGDGAVRYREHFEGVPGIEFGGTGLSFPSARSLVELAHPVAARGDAVPPGEIQPMYIRLPDAEINWKVRDGRS